MYRQLIAQLMAVGESQGQDEPVTSELIRAIFDRCWNVTCTEAIGQ